MVNKKTVVEQVERGKNSTDKDLLSMEFISDFEYEWWQDEVIKSSCDKNEKCN